MKTKILVYGKSQSRTALGIVNAYLKLHPNSTLSDLQKAFPKSLNPRCVTDEIIVPISETVGQETLFFEREDELIVLSNGQKISLVEAWVKEDYEAICEHALQYGIKVAEMEETKPFEKGSYELKFVEAATTAAPLATDDNKCNCKCWLWVLLLLLLLAIIVFGLKKCDSCAIKAPETSIAAPDSTNLWSSIKGKFDSLTNNFVYDTGDTISVKLPDGSDWKIGSNSSEFRLFDFLNSDAKVDTVDKSKNWITLDRLYFETGKAQLTADSEAQLQNVAKILKLFPNANIKVGGYSDNTGGDDINMKLSTERAKITADKLISLGLNASRVAYEGYGSAHPVCPPNDTPECRALNRRIDIHVTKK